MTDAVTVSTLSEDGTRLSYYCTICQRQVLGYVRPNTREDVIIADCPTDRGQPLAHYVIKQRSEVTRDSGDLRRMLRRNAGELRRAVASAGSTRETVARATSQALSPDLDADDARGARALGSHKRSLRVYHDLRQQQDATTPDLADAAHGLGTLLSIVSGDDPYGQLKAALRAGCALGNYYGASLPKPKVLILWEADMANDIATLAQQAATEIENQKQQITTLQAQLADQQAQLAEVDQAEQVLQQALTDAGVGAATTGGTTTGTDTTTGTAGTDPTTTGTTGTTGTDPTTGAPVSPPPAIPVSSERNPGAFHNVGPTAPRPVGQVGQPAPRPGVVARPAPVQRK